MRGELEPLVWETEEVPRRRGDFPLWGALTLKEGLREKEKERRSVVERAQALLPLLQGTTRCLTGCHSTPLGRRSGM